MAPATAAVECPEGNLKTFNLRLQDKVGCVKLTAPTAKFLTTEQPAACFVNPGQHT